MELIPVRSAMKGTNFVNDGVPTAPRSGVAWLESTNGSLCIRRLTAGFRTRIERYGDVLVGWRLSDTKRREFTCVPAATPEPAGKR